MSMRLAAHGFRVDLPRGWHGRIFRHPGGEPTMHVASFRLPAHDGDFGTHATAAMPRGGAFASVTEYGHGAGLAPGTGLFAHAGLPLPLDERELHPASLLVARPAQRGIQRFFSIGERALCLYAVLADPVDLAALQVVLRSAVIEPRRAR
jgi:hypothetical protein